MPGFILTTVPWGLLSLRKSEIFEFDDPGVIGPVPSNAHPLLSCSNSATPIFEDSHNALEWRAELPTDKGDPSVLYALPVPLRAEQRQRVRDYGWNSDAEIDWAGLLSRPTRKDSETRDTEDDKDRRQFQFLLGLVGRMQDFDAALAEATRFLPWENVFERWLEPEDKQDPTMDVVVQHATIYRARWAEIAQRPRRLLNRTRELVMLSRVEELDTHCMAWLSRQPGRTTPERAGIRQRIMALTRYENLNTLENRVFRDLLERTDAAARDYLRVNAGRRISRAGRGRSTRYSLVERYAQECRRLARELAELGINHLDGLVQPNFVLMQDNRYRHVWTAWQEIVQRKRVFDELWCWQRQAWAEFAKASCGLALQVVSGSELVVASPLSVRMEHRRGECLIHDDPLVIIANRHLGFIVELLDGFAPDVPNGLLDLGASAWLRLSKLAGGDSQYLAIWTTLGMAETLSLEELITSAEETIASFQKARPEANFVGGLVLQAEPDPKISAQIKAGESVTGICFGPFDKHLASGIEMLGDEIARLAKAAL